jgi:hypothetical protein
VLAFPASALAKVAFPVGKPGMFLMIRAYFDDSGTHRDSRAVVWAGVHGTDDQFTAFECEWERFLAEPLPGKPKLTKFSLGDCRNSVGEFESYTPAERDAVRYIVRNLISNAKIGSIAFCVPVDLWKKYLPPRAQRYFGGPDVVAFASVCETALNSCVATGGIPLACVFDKGQKSRVLDKHIDAVAEKRAEDLGLPISYTFGAVKDHYGLQAADTIATQHYWQVLEPGGLNNPADPHFKSMMKMNRPFGLVLGEQGLLEMKQQFLDRNPAEKWLTTPGKKRIRPYGK